MFPLKPYAVQKYLFTDQYVQKMRETIISIKCHDFGLN